MKTLQNIYHRVGPEPFIWLLALIYLALMNPASGSDFTLCPLKIIGFEHCPGCGLGRSVSFLLHGDVGRSLQCHLLGVPATAMLLFRIFSLLKNAWERKPFQQLITNNRSQHA